MADNKELSEVKITELDLKDEIGLPMQLSVQPYQVKAGTRKLLNVTTVGNEETEHFQFSHFQAIKLRNWLNKEYPVQPLSLHTLEKEEGPKSINPGYEVECFLCDKKFKVYSHQEWWEWKERGHHKYCLECVGRMAQSAEDGE